MFDLFSKKRREALCAGARRYIDGNYEPPKPFAGPAPTGEPRVMYSLNLSDDGEADRCDGDALRRALEGDSPQDILRALEDLSKPGFVERLQEIIRGRGLREARVYRAAQIDRRLFSKIISDRYYKPAKDTCVALCLALRLDPAGAQDLLGRAGYTLSHSSKRDLVLEYCFREGIYDLPEVNALLYKLGMRTLGRG